MKRLLKFCIILLFGAIVNVAVAWGFALSGDNSNSGGNQSIVVPPFIWPVSVPPNWPDPDGGEERFGTGWRMRFAAMFMVEYDPDGERLWMASRMDFGWPTLSISSLWMSSYLFSDGQKLELVEKENGIRLPRSTSRTVPRLLPTRPLWPGFAINTIFYAVLLWLLWIAPGAIRRYRIKRRRMREHRCLACNYQIAAGVGPNCSECGAKLPAKWSVKE